MIGGQLGSAMALSDTILRPSWSLIRNYVVFILTESKFRRMDGCLGGPLLPPPCGVCNPSDHSDP